MRLHICAIKERKKNTIWKNSITLHNHALFVFNFFYYASCLCVYVSQLLAVHFIFIIILFIYLAVCVFSSSQSLAIHFFFHLISANGFWFHFAFEIRVILLFQKNNNKINNFLLLFLECMPKVFPRCFIYIYLHMSVVVSMCMDCIFFTTFICLLTLL